MHHAVMFVFKQKTAYEMRISDWSSDVCSSDLTPNGCWHDHGVTADGEVSIWQDGLDIPLMNCLETNFYAVYEQPAQTAAFPSNDLPLSYGGAGLRPEGVGAWDKPYSPGMVYRSEEHTSELQSLMRISYAVFC